MAIKLYGAELLGFLRAIAHSDDLAADAFSAACEHLWRGLPRFRWNASLRTWLYRVGRNALIDLQRSPARAHARNLPLSVLSSVQEVQRTPTEPFRRTEVKAALRALRDSLPVEDRELLVLRLDRQMSWKDIARATSATEDESPASLTTRAASLRKRYERLKEQLRALAVEQGILDAPDD